ncbi:hypothetical protein [Actinomadura sp. 9N215]|uniref:hypothetical protein n=1 Tax=Actinomadura sp. 9N215 TaxID=3375150 RepID=UPI003792964C
MPNRTISGSRRRAAVSIALTALAAAGCGASDDGARPEQSESSPAPTNPAVTASPAATAADGTNVSACGDGNCEILVSGTVAIDPRRHGGLKKLSLTEYHSSELTFKAESREGTSTGNLMQGCTVLLTKFGESRHCSVAEGGSPLPPAPAPKQTGVIAMQIVGPAQDGVVLRLVSGKVGPPPASLAPPDLPG